MDRHGSNKVVAFSANSSWYLYHFRKGTLSAFIKQGHNVYCFAPDQKFSAQLLDLGVSFIPLRLDSGSINPMSELMSVVSIFSHIARLRPDYVFNFTIKMNAYVGICCALLNIPYANNVSGLGTAFLHHGWRFKLARILYGVANKKAHRVFMQNVEDKKFFIQQKLVKEQQVVLLPGSGVNVDYFNYHELANEKPFTFIMIARLIADKGVREYIGAAKLVKEKYPDTRFLLVGPSDVANKTAITAKEISQWEQEAVIEYLGEIGDVKPLLKSSHVLVLPSYREGMPRTVLEAASIGRPSIVSDVAGCRQAIKPLQTGWLCEAKSATALADVMQKALGTSDSILREMSLHCREYMESCFSEQLVIDAYLECFLAHSK